MSGRQIPPLRLFYDDDSYTTVCSCDECGTTGREAYGLSRYGPCPDCGSTKIKTRVGKWVRSAPWWAFWSSDGKWTFREKRDKP